MERRSTRSSASLQGSPTRDVDYKLKKSGSHSLVQTVKQMLVGTSWLNILSSTGWRKDSSPEPESPPKKRQRTGPFVPADAKDAAGNPRWEGRRLRSYNLTPRREARRQLSLAAQQGSAAGTLPPPGTLPPQAISGLQLTDAASPSTQAPAVCSSEQHAGQNRGTEQAAAENLKQPSLGSSVSSPQQQSPQDSLPGSTGFPLPLQPRHQQIAHAASLEQPAAAQSKPANGHTHSDDSPCSPSAHCPAMPQAMAEPLQNVSLDEPRCSQPGPDCNVELGGSQHIQPEVQPLTQIDNLVAVLCPSSNRAESVAAEASDADQPLGGIKPIARSGHDNVSSPMDPQEQRQISLPEPHAEPKMTACTASEQAIPAGMDCPASNFHQTPLRDPHDAATLSADMIVDDFISPPAREASDSDTDTQQSSGTSSPSAEPGLTREGIPIIQTARGFRRTLKKVSPSSRRNPCQPPLDQINFMLSSIPERAELNPAVAEISKDCKLVYEGLVRLRADQHQGIDLAADLEAIAVEINGPHDGDGPGIPLPAGSMRRAHDIFQNQSIIKEFDGVLHLGTVAGLEAERIFQHVQYADGDSEDLEDHEVLQQLATGPLPHFCFHDEADQLQPIQPGAFVTVGFEGEGDYPCRVEELWIHGPERSGYAIVREFLYANDLLASKRVSEAFRADVTSHLEKGQVAEILGPIGRHLIPLDTILGRCAPPAAAFGVVNWKEPHEQELIQMPVLQIDAQHSLAPRSVLMHWAALLQVNFCKKMKWDRTRTDVDFGIQFPEDVFKLLFCYSGLGVDLPGCKGRPPLGALQLFIPEEKFAAARVDLFMHGGWQDFPNILQQDLPSGKLTMQICTPIRLRLLPQTGDNQMPKKDDRRLPTLKVRFSWRRLRAGLPLVNYYAPAATEQPPADAAPEVMQLSAQMDAASRPASAADRPSASTPSAGPGIPAQTVYGSAGKVRPTHDTITASRAGRITAETAAAITGMPLAAD